MKCPSAQDQIGAYVDGELPEPALSELEKHLDECPECQAELRELRNLVSRFSFDSAESANPPPELWKRIEQRLNTSTPKNVVFIRFLRKPMAVAASLAILLGTGVFLTSWLVPSVQVAQAETIDYRMLLDGLGKDADASVDRFLAHYKATSMDVPSIMSEAGPMRFNIPEMLPGGYRLEQSYQLQFGPNRGYAAKYRRRNEPVFVCFHAPMKKTLMGVHRESHCALAEGSHCVGVGPWQLIHFTDPTTCHCLLSRSTNEQELRDMLAAISPELTAHKSSNP